jgi:hypothetical protein
VPVPDLAMYPGMSPVGGLRSDGGRVLCVRKIGAMLPLRSRGPSVGWSPALPAAIDLLLPKREAASKLQAKS